MDNFFQSSMEHKQSVNKKYNVEIDSAASGGGQGSPWPPLELALLIRTFCFLFTLCSVSFLLKGFYET